MLDYTYYDLPKKPWLRRLVLVFYFPLLFLICCMYSLMGCWEYHESTPLMRPFFSYYWQQFRDPLGDYSEVLG